MMIPEEESGRVLEMVGWWVLGEGTDGIVYVHMYF